jgi:hypothetical protein
VRVRVAAETGEPETWDPTSSRCFDFLDEFLGMQLSRECLASVSDCRKPEKERFEALNAGVTCTVNV